MKDTLTELVFILDRSGSMARLTSDTIGGFNSMIEEQKKEAGEAYVTTVLFDNDYEVLHNRMPLGEVPELTNKEYYARGSTALLDAVGRTISTVEARLAADKEEERPGKVIIVITTDGMENASREFKRAQVKNMISEKQEKDDWNFIFLGANMDAVSEARSLGIDENFARNYDASHLGTARMYGGITESMKTMRHANFNRKVRDENYAKAMADLDTVSDRAGRAPAAEDFEQFYKAIGLDVVEISIFNKAGRPEAGVTGDDLKRNPAYETAMMQELNRYVARAMANIPSIVGSEMAQLDARIKRELDCCRADRSKGANFANAIVEDPTNGLKTKLKKMAQQLNMRASGCVQEAQKLKGAAAAKKAEAEQTRLFAGRIRDRYQEYIDLRIAQANNVVRAEVCKKLAESMTSDKFVL